MSERQRLVLVDANESVREHVTASLVEQGYDCVGVSDLRGAAALSEQMSVSGVLVNVSTLDDQLVAAMVRFRNRHPGLPLLAFDPPELKEGRTGQGGRAVIRRHLRLICADGNLTPVPMPTLH